MENSPTAQKSWPFLCALIIASATISLTGAGEAHSAKHTQSPSPSPLREFEFRGARLGMSVTDFEALPQLENAGAIACGPNPIAKYASVGSMECTRPGDDPFLSIATIGYYFCLDEGNTERLCNILLMATNENFGETNFDKALRELTGKWGQPDKSVNGTAENGLGQPVVTHKFYWEGGANTITLEIPCAGDLRYFCVHYENSTLENAMEVKAKLVGPDAPSKF